MNRVVLDLRGMGISDLLASINQNLKELKESEMIEFIVDQEEIISHIKKLDLKMDVRKIGSCYILKVYGGQIKIEEAKGKEELKIDEQTNVGKLISQYPEAINILIEYGFIPLKNPLLRKTLAKSVSLGQAKKLIGLADEKFEQLIEELKELLERKK